MLPQKNIFIYIYYCWEKQRKHTVIVKQSSYESCITLISNVHAYTSSLQVCMVNNNKISLVLWKHNINLQLH